MKCLRFAILSVFNIWSCCNDKNRPNLWGGSVAVGSLAKKRSVEYLLQLNSNSGGDVSWLFFRNDRNQDAIAFMYSPPSVLSLFFFFKKKKKLALLHSYNT